MKPAEVGPAIISDRAFFRWAALGAALYLAAQLFQWVVVGFVLPTPATSDEAVLQRLTPLAQARSLVMLLSFPAVLVAYAGVAAAAFRRSTGPAALGLLFACVFVGIEVAYRSVDVAMVAQQWAPSLRDDPADILAAARVAELAAVWRELVTGLYLPLLLAHGLASAFLGAAVWSRASRLDQALSVLLFLNAARAFGRVLEMHAELGALGGLSARIYLPVTIALFGLMAFWLWRQGDQRSLEPRPVSPWRWKAGWPRAG